MTSERPPVHPRHTSPDAAARDATRVAARIAGLLLASAALGCPSIAVQSTGDASPDVVDVGRDTPDVTLDASVDVFDATETTAPDDVSYPSVRLVWPPSGARVGASLPALWWSTEAPDTNVVLDLCSDRAMTRGCRASITTRGDHVRITGAALSPGVWFWRVRARGDTREATVWQFEAPHGDHTRAADTAYGLSTDVNGDGLGDVLVVASETPTGDANLWVRYGTTAPPALRAGLGLVPTEAQGRGFVVQVAPLGDVDGDGFVDVGALASWTLNMEPVVRLLWLRGSPTGLRAPEMVPRSDEGRTVPRLVPVGDVDHDGYADVVLTRVAGMPDANTLFSGGPRGLTRSDRTLGTAVLVREGAADFDGDGYTDLLGDDGTGRWFFASGRATGLPVWQTTPLVMRTGARVAVMGDGNADGRSDVVLWYPVDGFHGYGSEVQVNLAVAAGATPTTVQTGALERSILGYARDGDLDGDGFDDFSFFATSSFGSNYFQTLWGAGSMVTVPIDAARGAVLGGPGDCDGDGVHDVVRRATPAGVSVAFGAASDRAATRVEPFLSTLESRWSLAVVAW